MAEVLFIFRCGFLHRTAGDTERRYHLRYYKTGTCVHETDSKGHCVKNGAHCAFAHGIHDLRAPVYDIRELKSMSDQITPEEVSLVLPDTVPATQLEKDRIINEDPKWNGKCELIVYRRFMSNLQNLP